MDDRTHEARNLASFALGMLTHKDASSVEAAVRSVLRIATLRGHARWRLWAELQLTELVDEETAKESVRPLIDASFPDVRRQEQILDFALGDYLRSRKMANEDEGSYYLADVGDIERDLPIYEASLMRKISVEHLEQRDLRHRILNRVKNSAQRYLMRIENASTQSISSADEP